MEIRLNKNRKFTSWARLISISRWEVILCKILSSNYILHYQPICYYLLVFPIYAIFSIFIYMAFTSLVVIIFFRI